MTELSRLFSPSRVAVIGATDRPGSVGRALMENLVADFGGDVVPVNPDRDTVLGRESYPSIGAVPGPIDLAVLAVPATAAVDVLREIAAAGVENVVAITAGFSETGPDGAERERRFAEIAAASDLNVVGPNSLGIISTSTGLNATFAPQNARPGPISFMSQSGAVVTAVLDWAAEREIGFTDIVSLGNEAVLDEVDFLRAWGDDADTDVIVGYLEDIDDGRGFIEAARDVTRDTPVVLIKSGRTAAGATAASSHTGSIAGSDHAYDAGMAQAGVIRAPDVETLFEYAQVLAGQPLPSTDDVGIVTNAGGPGVMATDAIADSRLSMASFTDRTRSGLREMLPDAANTANPIDVIGDADLDRFERAIDLVLDDPGVSAAVILSSPTALIEYDELARTIGDLHDAHGKPVVACLMGGSRARTASAVLDDYGIPNFFDPARAVRSLEALATYRDIRDRAYHPPADFPVDRERAREVLTDAVDRGITQLGGESLGLLRAYGIPVATSEVVTEPADAERVARDLDGPVVMKIVSPDITHKSDAGGVRLGIDPAAAPAVYEELVSLAHDVDPDAHILGVQVQELIDPGDGVELIVGMARDPQFGPVVMFGFGGIFVEVFADTSFRVAPVSEPEARAMTEEIEAASLLRGARGRDPVDIDAVTETIQRVSQLACDFPAVDELDINPLVASPDGITAVDLRLTVDPTAL